MRLDQNLDEGICPRCAVRIRVLNDDRVPWHKRRNADGDLVLCEGYLLNATAAKIIRWADNPENQRRVKAGAK